jgi:hypothetical protein
VLVLALFVGEVVDQVVEEATPASLRSMKSWVAAVVPIVAASNSSASTLRDVRELADLPACTQQGCQRRTFDSLLAQLESGTKQDTGDLAAVGLVPPDPRSGVLLEQVLRERARAVIDVVEAATLLFGSSGAHAVLARAQGLLLSGGADLVESDTRYRAFVGSLPRHVDRPRPPASRWVDHSSTWSRSSVQLWADRLLGDRLLRSTTTIALLAVSTEPPVLRIEGLGRASGRSGTAPSTTAATTTTTTTTTTTLAGVTTHGSTSVPPTTRPRATRPSTTTTVPPTTTTLQIPPPGSRSVLPPTRQLVVDVVVADEGNVPARAVTVAARLVAESGKLLAGSAAATVRAGAGALASGSARYLRLRPLRVVPGETYDLLVTASVPGWPVASDSVVVQVAG